MCDELLERNFSYCNDFIAKHNISSSLDSILENYSSIEIYSYKEGCAIQVFYDTSLEEDEINFEKEPYILLKDKCTKDDFVEAHKFVNYLKQIFLLKQVFDLETFDYTFYGKLIK